MPGPEGLLLLDADAHLELGGLLAGAHAHLAGVFGRVGDLGDRAVELALLEGVHLQVRLLPRRDAHHVVLADVHPRLHLIQVGDGHNLGPHILDRPQHPLAQAGVELADRPGERRQDGRLVQRVCGAVHRGLGDLDLMSCAFELRLGHIIGRLHFVERGVRHELVPEQVLAAFELRFGLPQVGLGHGLARQRGLVARVGLVGGGDVEVRLDLDQQVTLVDLLPFLDRQVNDFAADLGADLDLQHGLDSAVGQDQLGQVAPGDLLRLNGNDDLPLLEDHQRRQPQQRPPR